MTEYPLINERPVNTPLETNQENLEIMITMIMLVGQIAEAPDTVAENMTIIAAALNRPAEA
jgi:hypothetical protein